MSDRRFEGQAAIVTGGGSGIGKHIALRLAREGAAVTLWDHDRAGLDRAIAEFRAAGLDAAGEKIDVADEPAVAAATAEAARHRGRLDVMVHCAGIANNKPAPITEVPFADFERVHRVNLLGSFVCAKQALLAMKPRGYGRILLFASIAGKEGNAGMCAYSSSKAGVIGLVKSVGKEFAESGITVNAIAPAVIRTAMVEAQAPEQVKYMTDKIPMKRTGTLDEIAALSCWIVSREASFTTAFTFDLSGGRATY
jgi:3-oxoacyl-[acyl-carrier protein] reductase